VQRRVRTGVTGPSDPLIEHRAFYDPEVIPTYRPLAGAPQNNRGNARKVTLQTVTGGPAQFIPSIVETPKDSGDDAEVVTIQLSMDLPQSLLVPGGDPDNSAAVIDVVGILEWGVGGAFFTSEFDWNQGVCFSVVANVVRVSARVGAIAAGISLSNVDIVLQASLGYGNALSPTVSSCLRRTLSLGDIPAGGVSPLIVIPPWALGLTIVDAGGGPMLVEPDYTIRIDANSTGVVVAQYKLLTRTNFGVQIEGQFPIPIKGRFLLVRNNLTSATINTQAIFNLGF